MAAVFLTQEWTLPNSYPGTNSLRGPCRRVLTFSKGPLVWICKYQAFLIFTDGNSAVSRKNQGKVSALLMSVRTDQLCALTGCHRYCWELAVLNRMLFFSNSLKRILPIWQNNKYSSVCVFVHDMKSVYHKSLGKPLQSIKSWNKGEVEEISITMINMNTILFSLSFRC